MVQDGQKSALLTRAFLLWRHCIWIAHIIMLTIIYVFFIFGNSFNAGPGTGAAMRSAAARISIMKDEEKDELKREIKENLGTTGLNLKTLKKMKKLDAFTMEVGYSIFWTRTHSSAAPHFEEIWVGLLSCACANLVLLHMRDEIKKNRLLEQEWIVEFYHTANHRAALLSGTTDFSWLWKHSQDKIDDLLCTNQTQCANALFIQSKCSQILPPRLR